MLRSVFLLFTWLVFVIGGCAAPFVFGLGYLWIDFFSPQRIAYEILPSIPIALVLGAATVFGYLLFDRRDPPKLSMGTALMVSFCIWITLTTTWAEVPDAAWFKWDWAVKTLGFSILIPYLFRSRVQIEAAVLVVLSAVLGHVMAVAVKTMAGGGWYGTGRSLVEAMLGLGESSTLACVASASIPLILVMGRSTIILPQWPIRRAAAGALAFISVVAIVGTFARTGIIALGVLGAMFFWQSKRKFLFVIGGALVAVGALYFVQDAWYDRMYTIKTFEEESSALGRIAVWLWTIEYVIQNPLGGGFDVYRINEYSVPIGEGGAMYSVKGKAFHSIYFEILGEQGAVGFAIFSLILIILFLNLRFAIVKTRGDASLVWVAELARAFLLSIVVYLAGGSFIGIAYQPYLYFVFGISISLKAYVERLHAIAAVGPISNARLGDGIRRIAS